LSNLGDNWGAEGKKHFFSACNSSIVMSQKWCKTDGWLQWTPYRKPPTLDTFTGWLKL